MCALWMIPNMGSGRSSSSLELSSTFSQTHASKFAYRSLVVVGEWTLTHERWSRWLSLVGRLAPQKKGVHVPTYLGGNQCGPVQSEGGETQPRIFVGGALWHRGPGLDCIRRIVISTMCIFFSRNSFRQKPDVKCCFARGNIVMGGWKGSSSWMHMSKDKVKGNTSIGLQRQSKDPIELPGVTTAGQGANQDARVC